MKSPVILVINPGSTSTRLALYEGAELIGEQNLACSREELDCCERVIDQIQFRTRQVVEFMKDLSRKVSDCDAIAARGGPLLPVAGGVYRVNEAMLADAKSERFVEHPSKLACLIANNLAQKAGIDAFIVDPISTDEFDEISRISGLRELPRKSLTHALNMKLTARKFASEVGKPYESMNLIIAHLGGGITIAVHKRGRMIDSADANGEGPFSPERSGGLRVDDLARMAIESGKSFANFGRLLTRNGGLMSHLGTTDAREVEKRVENGDTEAKKIYEAMAYGIARHICALAAAVNGQVDAILLTGALARSDMLTGWISERVSFLAEVKIYPGQHEMQALHDGVTRILTGLELARVYPTGDHE